MKEACKVVIGHKVSSRLAEVVYRGPVGQKRDNICDVVAGKTVAPAHVKKFASSWLAAALG